MNNPLGQTDSVCKTFCTKWGWFVAIGALLIFFGFIALGNLFLATVASVYVVGAFMLVGGVLEIAQAFQVRGSFGLFIGLCGLFLTVAGVVAFIDPLLAMFALTLLLGISMIIVGAVEVWMSLQLRPSMGWGWMCFTGVIALVTGLIVLVGWPANSIWILGIFLGVNLLFRGMSYIFWGMGLKRLNT